MKNQGQITHKEEMFSLIYTFKYYFYNSATDMRKGFDGLCGLVQVELGRRPVIGEVVIFVNHQRDKMKLLHREQGGFVVYYKRLERGTLELPMVKRNPDSPSGSFKPNAGRTSALQKGLTTINPIIAIGTTPKAYIPISHFKCVCFFNNLNLSSLQQLHAQLKGCAPFAL